MPRLQSAWIIGNTALPWNTNAPRKQSDTTRGSGRGSRRKPNFAIFFIWYQITTCSHYDYGYFATSHGSSISGAEHIFSQRHLAFRFAAVTLRCLLHSVPCWRQTVPPPRTAVEGRINLPSLRIDMSLRWDGREIGVSEPVQLSDCAVVSV